MGIQETDLSHRQSESYILLQTWLAKNQLSRTKCALAPSQELQSEVD